MGMNYMSDVAKILGVEIEEEFDIVLDNRSHDNNPFKITKDGLLDRDKDSIPELLLSLLRGIYKIVKKPWEPENGEVYWFLTYDGHAMISRFNDDYTTVHQMRVRMGNFFKTEQEAKSYKEKWLAYYNQGADMSWRD